MKRKVKLNLPYISFTIPCPGERSNLLLIVTAPLGIVHRGDDSSAVRIIDGFYCSLNDFWMLALKYALF